MGAVGNVYIQSVQWGVEGSIKLVDWLLIVGGMAMYIPCRTTKRKDSCPWIDKELHQITKTHVRLYKKSKTKGSAKAEQHFKMYKQIAKKQFRKKTFKVCSQPIHRWRKV